MTQGVPRPEREPAAATVLGVQPPGETTCPLSKPLGSVFGEDSRHADTAGSLCRPAP